MERKRSGGDGGSFLAADPLSGVPQCEYELGRVVLPDPDGEGPLDSPTLA